MESLSHPPLEPFAALRRPLAAHEVVLEADRCLECGGPYASAPCTLACPAGIDVPGFVGALARDDAAGAAETIFAENLLGGTCARVCPVELLCEGACVLAHEGRPPVEIGLLQRYATDWTFERAGGPRPVARNGRRVAVVGAGPAGMACAGELARLGYAVTVYDEHPEPGGLARYAIAPYRLEREPLPAEVQMLERLGVELRLGARIESAAMLRAIEENVDAIFLAVGLGADLVASLPGEELPGVWPSLRFVEALKTGQPPSVGRRVAVVGGGNTAIDVAREALRLGAREVTLVYRRTEAEMPAYPHEVAEAREEGVRFQWLTLPLRFLGGGLLEAIECRYARLGDPDASGRRRPEPVPGTEFVLPADTAVVAIGQRPHTELADWIEGLAIEHGRLVVEPETGRTGNPKYFAGGDATNGGATVVEAVREAKLAARAIERVLGGGR
jgi:glutamate synthase (NADPH/NADH) small chain